jgi:hypothetical protein
MSFIVPDDAKPIAAGTARNYKRYLNRIAMLSGIDTVDKVVEEPQSVIDAIDILIVMEDDKEKQKQEARVYYSALFYALFSHPILKTPDNIFRRNFHRFNPSKTSDGNTWKSVSDFRKSK